MDDFKELHEMFGENVPSFLVENAQRKERWAYLTEGLDTVKRLQLEMILDNTQRWLINETSDTSNVKAFTTYGFPLIRRVFPGLIAHDLVSVQPMPMPTAKIFFLDWVYGSTRHGIAAGDAIGGVSVDSVSGKHSYAFSPVYAGGMVRGLLITDNLTGGGDDQEFVISTISDGAFADLVPLDGDSLVVYVDGEIYPNAVVSNETTGKFKIKDIPATLDGATVTVDYAVKTPTEGGDDIPELDWNMRSESISAETDKLKARWTLEGQQDLLAYHGVSAETELLVILGDTIRRGIDRKILNQLNRVASAGNVNWPQTMPSDFEGSDREWRMTIYDAIIDANNLIYKKRYRNATWIVADPDTCSLLEKLDGFTEIKPEWSGTAGQGIERFGILRNRFQVYKDPWATPGRMLLGHKGTTMFETGYVYAPYVPLYTTPAFMDPNDLTPRRAVMSRYARKAVITDLYATVTLT